MPRPKTIECLVTSKMHPNNKQICSRRFASWKNWNPRIPSWPPSLHPSSHSLLLLPLPSPRLYAFFLEANPCSLNPSSVLTDNSSNNLNKSLQIEEGFGRCTLTPNLQKCLYKPRRQSFFLFLWKAVQIRVKIQNTVCKKATLRATLIYITMRHPHPLKF